MDPYVEGILPKGPYPRVGPFWQDTLDVLYKNWTYQLHATEAANA